jgi:phage terminase small subunit
MRGRKPKPSFIKLLDGNPGKRPLNDREPSVLSGAPEAHDGLDAEAQAEWEQLVGDLDAKGILSRTDRTAMAAHCTD